MLKRRKVFPVTERNNACPDGFAEHLQACLREDFPGRLVQWQKRSGRHDMPWQVSDPYWRWLSEIMLQQTQVPVVREYFERFVRAFPTVQALAGAQEDQVMRLWAGLGYYARARNLHAAARMIVERFDGRFPQTVEELEQLPGIGRSTAGAIASFAFGVPAPILDGNVKRVLSRVFAHGDVHSAQALRDFWAVSEALVSPVDPGIYNQAFMDLGATVCTKARPSCESCPVRDMCLADQRDIAQLLPTARPKQARRAQKGVFLLCWQEDRIFLQRRGERGIWQGLMSLPWVEAWEGGRLLTTITHDFTHFRLTAQVREVDPADLPESDGVWLTLAEALDAALPTPLRELLESL